VLTEYKLQPPMPLANWGTIAQQLAIKFGDRFKLL